jgi:hypothetical protein
VKLVVCSLARKIKIKILKNPWERKKEREREKKA